jgi:hypothetical protein
MMICISQDAWQVDMQVFARFLQEIRTSFHLQLASFGRVKKKCDANDNVGLSQH